jgi:AAA+ ATPase superfamily predicted ATPase
MDSFIKVVEQKKDPVLTTIHTKQIELVRKYIREGKNVFICGATGVGKTYVLRAVLEGLNHVELEAEHLRSKSLFLPFIKPSTKHVFIEDYDPVFKPIIECVSDGDRLSRGVLLVTTTNMCMYPNFETVFIPRHKPEVLMTLVEERGFRVQDAAVRSRGNIRTFFSYLKGYDEMDDFKSPKEFIAEVLSSSEPLEIRDSIAEHGHMWDIFQENYLDSKGVDILRVSEAFSQADMYDTHMYSSGNWHLMPYFILNALTIPKSALGEPLEAEKIRPGSCWTKRGNYLMRKHKFEEIKKKSRMGLGTEELCLLKKYAEKGDLEPLLEYGITPQDFDVINHLAVGNGLKSRDVTRVKKALHHAYDR